jgi:uncharacterized protein (DUF1501 family)
MGGPVRGGTLHGRWPGLAQDQLYEAATLAMTTDFRDLLGEILTRHWAVRDLRRGVPGPRTGKSPATPASLRGLASVAPVS